MTPATQKHQQLILLEPDKARLLAELSAETRIPKQVLLRDAVDDLLAKHGKTKTAWYAQIVGVLRLAKAVGMRYRGMTEEVLWRAKCDELRKGADELLEILYERR